jgi:hypothetical protein
MKRKDRVNMRKRHQNRLLARKAFEELLKPTAKEKMNLGVAC